MGDLIPLGDWRRWRSARSLADLAELTALWLEGKIAVQPGHPPGAGPGRETVPLVPALASLCRAGYMTAASQPSVARGPGWLLEARAAVHGFTDPATVPRIADAALAAGLEVVATAPGHSPGPESTLIVSRRRRRLAVTAFGPVPAWHIRSPVTGWGRCHPDAVTALRGAWQVTAADPWDRPGLLWQTLQAALDPREAERR